MFCELERIGDEAIVAYLKVLQQDSPRGTEEYHETPEPGYLASRLRFEPGTSQIQVRSATT
jgi:hypothetical protein